MLDSFLSVSYKIFFIFEYGRMKLEAYLTKTQKTIEEFAQESGYFCPGDL